MTSPTARSLAYCRKVGWPAAVVEKWNPHSKTRHDLFGMFDLLILVEGVPPNIIGVQACAGASHAARVAKVKSSANLAPWLACGGGAEVWSWAKQGPRGKRKTWTLRAEEVEP